MNKLYNSSGHIKISNLKKALKNAKTEGDLHGVPSSVIDRFVDTFEEKLDEHHRRVGDQINSSEVDFLIDRVSEEKHDNVRQDHIEKIKKILLDKDFDAD